MRVQRVIGLAWEVSLVELLDALLEVAEAAAECAVAADIASRLIISPRTQRRPP